MPSKVYTVVKSIRRGIRLRGSEQCENFRKCQGSGNAWDFTLSLPDPLTKQTRMDVKDACRLACLASISLASPRSELALCLSVSVSLVQDTIPAKRNQSPPFSAQGESPELDLVLQRQVSSCNLGGPQELEEGEVWGDSRRS